MKIRVCHFSIINGSESNFFSLPYSQHKLFLTCQVVTIFTAAKDEKYFNYAGTAEWAQLDLQSIQHRDYFGHLSIFICIKNKDLHKISYHDC